MKNSTLIRDERGQRVYSGPETGDWWIDIEVIYLKLSCIIWEFEGLCGFSLILLVTTSN